MRWPLKIIRIAGHSMQPLIRDGELLFVNKWAYLFKSPKIGDIVVFRNPKNKNQLFCKRIAGIGDGRLIVRGDNVADSLDVEPIESSLILGKAFHLTHGH